MWNINNRHDPFTPKIDDSYSILEWMERWRHQEGKNGKQNIILEWMEMMSSAITTSIETLTLYFHCVGPYFKKMKVGYIASVLTDETIELYPTFWGTIFNDDNDD